MENCVWNYDYVRLAWDSGFCFENTKARSTLDWSSIGLIDVDKVVADRDIAVIEKYIPTVLQFRLTEELSRILEPNFVKVFRLSQLSMQYLIFCKKYLDNTVVLLKKELAKNREDINKWPSKEEDYKNQISTLKRKNKELKAALEVCPSCPENTFKCPECSKLFSSEEFLNAHIKRRHETASLFQTETDKLQLEIKQLKEQLNSTEKYEVDSKINNETASKSNDSSIKEHSSRMKDLHSKFDKLKEHVENEMRRVNDQKFYLEKCEKWMEMAFLKLGTSRDSYDSQEKVLKKTDFTDPQKTTSSTQTALDSSAVMKIEKENLQQLVSEAEHRRTGVEKHLKEIFKLQQQIKTDTCSQIEHFEEVVQEKVASSLQKLEGQMSLFWNKLSEIQRQSKLLEPQPELILPRNQPPEDVFIHYDEYSIDEPLKPKPKPRSKVKQKQHKEEVGGSGTENTETEDSKGTLDSPDKIPIESSRTSKRSTYNLQQPGHVVVNLSRKSNVVNSNTSKASTMVTRSESSELSDSENDSKNSDRPTMEKLNQTLDENSIESIKEALSNDNEMAEDLRKELEQLIQQRLEDVGIYPKWSGIPEKSFKKAIRIIRHQGSLASKNYPEYANIRGKIVKDVEAQISATAPKKKRNISKTKKPKSKDPIIKSHSADFNTKAKPQQPISKSASHSSKNIKSMYKTADEHSSPRSRKASRNKFPKSKNRQKGDVKKMYGSSDEISSIVEELATKAVPQAPKVPQEVNVLVERQKLLLTELKEKVAAKNEQNTIPEEDLGDGKPESVHQVKSLLKSAHTASSSSLAKKKVLFDLESISSANNSPEVVKNAEKLNIAQPQVPTNDIGKDIQNTIGEIVNNMGGKKKLFTEDSEDTSIGSSVLEMDAARPQAAPRKAELNPTKINEVKEEEDASDWDISDLLLNKI